MTDWTHRNIHLLQHQRCMRLLNKALPINNDNSNTLYIHWAYQPNGLQQKDIRDRYNAILQPHLNYDHMQIAIARPRNLKDTLTRSALTIPPHMDLGNLIQQYATEPHQT